MILTLAFLLLLNSTTMTAHPQQLEAKPDASQEIESLREQVTNFVSAKVTIEGRADAAHSWSIRLGVLAAVIGLLAYGAQLIETRSSNKLRGIADDKARAEERIALLEKQKSDWRVADAQRQAAEANRTAESERLARLHLEARLADRVISPDQQRRITEILSPLRGRTVDIIIAGHSLEVSKLADTIQRCIHNAGLLRSVLLPYTPPRTTGIAVGVRKDAPPEVWHAAELLIPVLRQAVGPDVGTVDERGLDLNSPNSGRGDRGATPFGQAPLLIQISPKEVYSGATE